MNSKQQQLLNILADGQLHSCKNLCEQLHLNETELESYIHNLVALGVNIIVNANQCKVPSGIELLNEKKIHLHLNPLTEQTLSNIRIFSILPSTNQYLLDETKKMPIVV